MNYLKRRSIIIRWVISLLKSIGLSIIKRFDPLRVLIIVIIVKRKLLKNSKSIGRLLRERIKKI